MVEQRRSQVRFPLMAAIATRKQSRDKVAELVERPALPVRVVGGGGLLEQVLGARSGQTWGMGFAVICFEPPVRSFLSGLGGALRAGASRVCAGPAEMLARTGEFGVGASRS